MEYKMQGEIGRTVDVHFLVDCRTLVIEIIGGNFSQFVVGHGCNRNQRNLHETEIQECFSVFFDITGPGCNKQKVIRPHVLFNDFQLGVSRNNHDIFIYIQETTGQFLEHQALALSCSIGINPAGLFDQPADIQNLTVLEEEFRCLRDILIQNLNQVQNFCILCGIRTQKIFEL